MKQQLLSLAERTIWNRKEGNERLHLIEYFAGSGSLSRAFLRKMLSVASFDRISSAEYDCLTSNGLALWLDALSISKRGALLWFRMQCSSFSVLCKAQSERHAGNNYLGNTSRAFVQEGKCLAQVTALVWLVGFLCEYQITLEQPLLSTLPQLPCLQRVLQFSHVVKISAYLGHYGSMSAKPLQLLSTHDMYDELSRGKPTWATETLADKGGARYNGRPDDLLLSQSYPSLFSDAVCAIFMRLHNATAQ